MSTIDLITNKDIEIELNERQNLGEGSLGPVYLFN